MTSRGVFLDRDGVINRYLIDYVRTLADFEYESGAAEAFRILGEIGLPIVVVTNQSGIGRGYTTAAAVEAIHARLSTDAARWGGPISSIEICPHTPDARCACRKPESELFRRAAARFGFDLEGSFMIGDAPSDIEAAQRLAIRAVRVGTGRGGEPLPIGIAAETTVGEIEEAARWIATQHRATHPEEGSER